MKKEQFEYLLHQRDVLADVYDAVGLYSQADRVRNCYTNAEVVRNPSTDEITVINRPWRCGDRWCAICQWRNSVENMAITYRQQDEQQREYVYRLVTLTVSNVKLSDLKATVDRMNLAWSRRLINYAVFKRAVKGYIIMHDLTYNPDTDTYHPHFHILTAHVPSYGHNASYYITKAKWLELWRRAMRDNTITQVDVKSWDEPPTAVGYSLLPDISEDREIPISIDTITQLRDSYFRKSKIRRSKLFKYEIKVEQPEGWDYYFHEYEAGRMTAREVILFANLSKARFNRLIKQSRQALN